MTKEIGVIGGTDSSQGAGLGADQKTINDHGCNHHSVMSAITFQNSIPSRIHPIPVIALKHQLKCLSKIPLDAIKIGMLPEEESIFELVDFLKNSQCSKIILDPVRSSSSGTELLPAKAWESLITHLVPYSHLITPNLIEAKLLLGIDLSAKTQPIELARACLELGSNSVLLKGGHMDDPSYSTDIWVTHNKGPQFFQYRRIPGGTKVRGTGCRLASAISCEWALSGNLERSIEHAGKYLQRYIQVNL